MLDGTVDGIEGKRDGGKVETNRLGTCPNGENGAAVGVPGWCCESEWLESGLGKVKSRLDWCCGDTVDLVGITALALVGITLVGRGEYGVF